MRIRRWCTAAGVAAMATLAVALPGCGWTARDQFLADRSVSIAPAPGDGSERFSQAPQDPFRSGQAVNVAEFPNR